MSNSYRACSYNIGVKIWECLQVSLLGGNCWWERFWLFEGWRYHFQAKKNAKLIIANAPAKIIKLSMDFIALTVKSSCENFHSFTVL